MLRQFPMPSHDHPKSQPVRVIGGTVGGRIDAARKARGITQRELARRVGSRPEEVSKWIGGTKRPGPDNLKRIAEALSVTVDELLAVYGGEDPPFDAWADFVATPEGASMTAEEREMMRSLLWPTGQQPTLMNYLMIFAGVRAGRVR